MIVLGIAIGIMLVAIVFLAVVVHREDANRQDRRRADPFHAETERLAASGLLFQVGDETGLGRGPTYYVTPAGEAALRAHRTAPSSAPRLLSFSPGGLAVPSDLRSRVQALHDHHAARAADLVRVIALLETPNAGDWSAALETARLSHRFERHAQRFWTDQLSVSR